MAGVRAWITALLCIGATVQVRAWTHLFGAPDAHAPRHTRALKVEAVPALPAIPDIPEVSRAAPVEAEFEPLAKVDAPQTNVDFTMPVASEAPEFVAPLAPAESTLSELPTETGNSTTAADLAAVLAVAKEDRAQLLAARAQVAELSAEVAQAAALKEQHDRDVALLAEVEKRLGAAGTLQAETVQAVEAANAQVDQANEQLKARADEVAAGKTEANALREDLAAAHARIETLRAQLDRTAEELAVSRRETESMKQALDTAVKDIEAANTRTTETKQALADEKEHAAALTDANTMLKNDVSDMQAEALQQQQQLEALHGEYAILQDRMMHPDLVEALRAKSTDSVNQLYEHNPALAAAVNKTRDMLLPSLVQSREAGGLMLNQTHEKISEIAKPYVGESYLPMVAGLLVYGLVFIPLFLSFWCLASVHARLKLRPLLSFCHLYYTLVLLVCAGAALALDQDPLKTFQEQDASTYLFVQGAMAVLFLVYAGMMCAAFVFARNNAEWVVRLIQLGATMTMASVYYQIVWEPSMLDKPPQTLSEDHVWLPYAVGAAAWAVVMYLERVQRQRVAEDPAVRTRADDDVIRITVDVSEGEQRGTEAKVE